MKLVTCHVFRLDVSNGAYRARGFGSVGVSGAESGEATADLHDNCSERGRHLTPGEFLIAYPVEVQVGGATVFVVPVDSFEKI